MKKLLLIALVIFIGGNVVAQDNDELELFQSTFKLEKKELLMDFLMLNDTQSAAFWPIYDEYQAELTKSANKRLALMTEYIDNYDSMTGEEADKLTNESFTLRMDRDKLQLTYYKKIKKAVGSIVGAQFVQFERFIQSAIDDEMYNSFPLIGERL